MKIGFIGYGEAAYEMSFGLNQEGLKGIIAYDPMWDNVNYNGLIKKRAREAEVELLPTMEEVITQSTILIVAVPADKALDVCSNISTSLIRDTLYIDVSASKPDIKTKIAAEIKIKDSLFVDAAMMGSLPLHKHKVPILASGTGADRFIEWMSKFNMNINKVSENAGDASATKLIRSIFMKGISTLLFEMLEAAKSYQVEDMVTESIYETMDGDFKEILNRLILGTAVHARRRATELEGSIQLLKEANLDASMSIATKEKLDYITTLALSDQFKGEVSVNWSDIISATQNH